MILTSLIIVAALVLFLAGMQMSAFFSGSETGFYRVSQLQLNLQKQQGDAVARQLVNFADHPARFVSTTLVGNNVANYLTTLAIGLFVAEASGQSGPAGTAEIAATLMLAPVVFVFCELIPKSLYYRAPLSLLRSRSGVFRFFYLLFLPLSYPLTLIAELMSRLTHQESQSVDTMFGRTRLFGLIASGKRDGILTQIQGRLADNLMSARHSTLAQLMEAVSVLPAADESADRMQLIELAKQRRSGWILIHRNGSPNELMGVVQVAEILVAEISPKTVRERLPVFQDDVHPLVALSELFRSHSRFAQVIDSDNDVVGLIRRDRLTERVLIGRSNSRPPRTAWEL